MPHDAAVSYLVLSNGEVQVHVPQHQQVEPPSENQEPLPENTAAARETSGADRLVVTVEGPSSSAGGVYPGTSAPDHPAAVDLAATVSPSSAALHPQFCQDLGVSAVLPRRVMQRAGEAPPPRVAWGQEGDECSICLGVMAAGEQVSDLPGLNQTCNHTFHLACAVRWLTTRVEEGKKGSCPVCNTEVISPIFLVRSQPPTPEASGPTRTRRSLSWHACTVCVLILLSVGLITYQIILHTTSTIGTGTSANTTTTPTPDTK